MFHAPRGRATRHATPRHTAPPGYTLLYPTILFSSLSVSLTSLPPTFSPLSSPFFLSSFISQQHPQSACANWSPPPPAPRETIIPARGRKRKKERKKYQFFSFEHLRLALGIMFSKFSSSFFLFRPVYYYSILVCNLSLHGFRCRNVSMPASQRIRTSIIEYFAPNAIPPRRSRDIAAITRPTCNNERSTKERSFVVVAVMETNWGKQPRSRDAHARNIQIMAGRCSDRSIIEAEKKKN